MIRSSFLSPLSHLACLCISMAAVLFAFSDSPHAESLQDTSHGQVIRLYWKKEEIYDRNRQTVTLTGSARAQRGTITVDADTLVGYLRQKTANPTSHSTNSTSSNNNMELYRVEAIGHVHVYNQEDQGWGDHGLYDVDKAVMLMTGHAMKFTTPHQLVTARDLVEYYPNTHISIGRGDATVTTSDGKRITADVMKAVELTAAQKAENRTSQKDSHGSNTSSSSLDRAYGWGHVIIRTSNQTATGDRGIYLAGPQIARLIGHVRVTQGQNQNNGSQALVNMKTGISHMLPGTDTPIQGLVVPNEAN